MNIARWIVKQVGKIFINPERVNPIVEFVKNGGDLSTREGNQLIYEAEKAILEEAWRDTETADALDAAVSKSDDRQFLLDVLSAVPGWRQKKPLAAY